MNRDPGGLTAMAGLTASFSGHASASLDRDASLGRPRNSAEARYRYSYLQEKQSVGT